MVRQLMFKPQYSFSYQKVDLNLDRVESMASERKTAFEKLLSGGFPLLKWVMTFLLVLSLSSCVDKPGSQELIFSNQVTAPQNSQIAGNFSETAPPEVIQELRSFLESYQPQVTIVTPHHDEIIQDNTVAIRLKVQDLPLYKDFQWQLGSYLHVMLDNEPFKNVYDVNEELTISDLTPGTHTIRVFAVRPWHESFKNEGAYAQSTFHIFTQTDDNHPDSTLPLLTYSRPQESYGAEPILLDFYLTNAPLHIKSPNQAGDQFSDWRIRCTINGENFVLDRWQPIYLKGFKPGKNWVKLEFLDNQGIPVKNAFNTTVRLITYNPQGKDTLSKIVRGELTVDQVRGIVDPDYRTQTPPVESLPTIEEKPIPKTEVPQLPEKEATEPLTPSPTPEVEIEPTPSPTPEVEIEPTPSPTPEVEIEPTPSPTPEVEVEPTPSPTPEVEVEPTPLRTPEVEQKKTGLTELKELGRYFQHRSAFKK
ncbi:hypothetical protein B6N60_02711 [Richelia sinica FACHB-800]|uniref:FHA domain containing protein n=1 Tax=Richelia sinica FACHB-800 TaxID=1357546 RepID=A0A975T8J1_9NOST|nr:hypothetical protein [Richelia sinica]MBD2665888.1 hypothetical protein [Richelia sinica FACHB-800]QXE24009.1 hypothetical protein B6N60_02711 [Richelia sinica FACHB-800]